MKPSPNRPAAGLPRTGHRLLLPVALVLALAGVALLLAPGLLPLVAGAAALLIAGALAGTAAARRDRPALPPAPSETQPGTADAEPTETAGEHALRRMLARNLDEKRTLHREIRDLREEVERYRQATARAEQEMRAAQLVNRRLHRLLGRELRTPMNSLLGIVELLLDSDLDARGRRLARSLHHSLENLQELLDRALIPTCDEEAARPDREERLHLPPFLDDLLHPFRDLAAQKGLTLATAIDPALPEQVRADPVSLARLVESMVRRILAITVEGEVRVEVSGRPGPEDELTLQVCAGGAAPEAQWRALEQALAGRDAEDGEVSPEVQAAARLARCLGGRMTLSRREGGITCLVLSLPMRRETETAPETGEPAPVPAAPPSRRVLLVEDHAVNQVITTSMLEALGCEVTLAASGEEAVELAAGERFDLIFMDCHMPRVDGFEACRRIRQAEKEGGHPAVPVIALTADVHEGIRERCRDAGMDDYISKPYTREDLARCLARWLPESGAGPEPSAVEQPEAARAETLLDPSRLEALRTVSQARGSNLLEKAARHYIDHTPGELRRLRRAIGNGMADEARLTAHNLKSSSDMLGATAIAAHFSELEQLARKRALDRAGPVLERAEALLPAVLEALEEAIRRDREEPRVQAVPAERASGRILLVDDDPAFRLITSASLREAGFTVEEATTGAEALEMIGRSRPELILLDALMHEMDGFELCRRLQEDPETRQIPVLMVTGLEDTESVNRAFQAGAAGFITKPVNYPVLIHRIRFQLRVARESRELRESREQLAMAQQLARLGHWRWERDGERFEISDQLARICELDLRHWRPTLENFIDLIDPQDREQFRLAMRNALEKEILRPLDYRITTSSGRRLYIHQEMALPRPGVLLATVQDVTRQYESEQKIRKLAYSDELTGLASRSYFQRHLEDTIHLAERHDEKFSLLYLDLDSFKDINDTLGHDVGDELLKEVARRLQKVLRKTDFAARLGGDEFCILVDNVSINYAAEVASRCLEEVNRPIRLGSQTFNPRISIGIANFPSDGRDAQALLKAADSAMYAAKQEGKHRYAFYQPELTIRAKRRLDLEHELRRALEREDLELHYQPQVSLRSGRLVGVEALVRWKHASRGLVPPDEFIHVAERIGLIQELGNWVLHTACRQAARWIDEGADLQIAVNISPLHFKDPSIVEQVQSALSESGLQPGHLELEVTEGVVQTDPANMESFKRLKELGVRIAIDDFGTGYSSLSSLKKLPIDCLKVDQLFVRDMLDEPESATLVGTIIGLAKALGLDVVAEGVESEEEIQILAGLGCDLVQGYYFSRPVAAEEMAGLLDRIYLPPGGPLPPSPRRHDCKGIA